jgi:hypothetical protein
MRRLGGQVVGVKGVDMELERMKEGKKREWRSKGYSENFIKMAGDLADEWATSMTSAFAPPELRDAVLRHVYPKGLEVASKWIETMAVPVK